MGGLIDLIRRLASIRIQMDDNWIRLRGGEARCSSLIRFDFVIPVFSRDRTRERRENGVECVN